MSDNTSADCLICCEPLLVVALGSCNHRATCAICSVRLRQVYALDLKSAVFSIARNSKKLEFADLDRYDMHPLQAQFRSRYNDVKFINNV
jgi:hypothetical protein